MSDISSQINAKNVSLNVDLPKNLAPIYADRVALQKIFMQILSYATAASPLQGTVHVRVQIKAEDDKEYLLIHVSDTGGTPPEVLLRELNRSDRTDKVPRSQDGVYMDVRLSMAKTLTEAQDGRIWVHTEAGVGTTYNVLIPMGQNTQVNGSTKDR
jgi:signal transduction histidine kinase